MSVVDPVHEVLGALTDVWNTLRFRGIPWWVPTSSKANVERAVLTARTVVEAGVRVPQARGIAQVAASIVELTMLPPALTPIHDVPDRPSDDVLEDMWGQLLHAHERAVTHRNLDFDAVRIDDDVKVWPIDWD